MKPTSVINLATFLAISLTIVSGVVGLLGSNREQVLDLQQGIADLQLRQAELTRDLLALLSKKDGRQDALAASSQELVSAALWLTPRIEAIGADHGPLRRHARALIDATEQRVNQVERVRSLSAVLNNGVSNLPRLLAGIRENPLSLSPATSADVEISDSLDRIAEMLPRLNSDDKEAALATIIAASDRIQASDPSGSGSGMDALLHLVVAQAKRIVDYQDFLDSDVESLLSPRFDALVQKALSEASNALETEQLREQQYISCLSIGSTGLIAFVAAGLFRFRSQSLLLRRLNNDLEARVFERTVELDESRRRSEAQLIALDRVQGRVEFTPTGKILDVNDIFAKTMGYQPSELIGNHHCMLVPEETARSEAYSLFWSQLRAGRFHLGEYRRVTKDGEPRWIHATYSPVTDDDGHVLKIIKYATDLTAQKQNEAKALESSRLASDLATIIRESPNELYIVDAESLLIVEANQGAIDSIGYSREELATMRPTDLTPLLNEEGLRKQLRTLVDRESEAVDFSTTLRRVDGSEYPAQVRLHMANYGGADVFVAFVTDLTEPQRLEQQLAQAQKLESIGQLAAGVAHEINTPMQFVGDNLEYISQSYEKLLRVLDEYRDTLDNKSEVSWTDRKAQIQQVSDECRIERVRDQMPAAIEESREGVRRIVKIIRAMKEFSHPGTEQKTPCNLNDLISSTVAISRNRWKYAAELKLDLAPDLPYAPMFDTQMNQVLLNLIVNAGDAIAEKYSQVENGMGTISIRTYSNANAVFVEIEDDGCGIPESIRQKVFDPFFTTKEVGKGTGQGLSITHDVVVKLHGGSVLIDSEPGVGTAFVVELPLCDEQHDAMVPWVEESASV